MGDTQWTRRVVSLSLKTGGEALADAGVAGSSEAGLYEVARGSPRGSQVLIRTACALCSNCCFDYHQNESIF